MSSDKKKQYLYIATPKQEVGDEQNLRVLIEGYKKDFLHAEYLFIAMILYFKPI